MRVVDVKVVEGNLVKEEVVEMVRVVSAPAVEAEMVPESYTVEEGELTGDFYLYI